MGLNLPQADTVIHYDPWWHPAVETQATGRKQPLFTEGDLVELLRPLSG